MGIKLSEFEVIPGFNRVASALFKENGIDPTKFDYLFPDQVNNIISFDDFFNGIPILKNTDKFVERIKNIDRYTPICVYGDYDRRWCNGHCYYVS